MVYLRDGIVIYSYCTPSKIRLGEIMVKSGRITAPQLEMALKIQENNIGKRLGEVLVEMEIVERAEMEELVKFQVKETLYHLLGWEFGTFKFYENRLATEENITVSLSAENIILEGVRRIDELSRIKVTLPPLNSVLALAPASGRQRRDIMLEAPEWNLLATIDGRTSIDEVLGKTTLGRLEALKMIKGFILAGLITVAEPGPKEPSVSRFESMVKRLDDVMEKFLAGL